MRWLSRILTLLVLSGVGFGAWKFAEARRDSQSANSEFALVKADRGAISVTVVESGSLESSDNATVKCKVEAVLGTVSTATTGSAMTGGGLYGEL